MQSWPTNPVEHYVSILSKYPPKSVIADLGCGDAALAHRLSPDGMIVLSFDLVSTDPHVVRADICSSIPLPGSEGTEDEKSEGEGQIVDVVVCALSLMGTNWPKCIREAWRILRPRFVNWLDTCAISDADNSGELKIAEVASRIEDVQAFTSLISSMGFKLTSKVRVEFAVESSPVSDGGARTIPTPISRSSTSRRYRERTKVKVHGNNCRHAEGCSSTASTSDDSCRDAFRYDKVRCSL